MQHGPGPELRAAAGSAAAGRGQLCLRAMPAALLALSKDVAMTERSLVREMMTRAQVGNSSPTQMMPKKKKLGGHKDAGVPHDVYGKKEPTITTDRFHALDNDSRHAPARRTTHPRMTREDDMR